MTMRVAMLSLSLAAAAPRAFASPCARENTTGLEAIDSQNVTAQVFAGGRLTLTLLAKHGAGQKLDAARTYGLLQHAASELRAAGWLVPGEDSPMVPTVAPVGPETSSLSLTLVSAPQAAGNHTQRLPALPIVVRQASGASTVLCTESVAVEVLDPTLPTPDAPRGQAPALPEMETWVAARWALGAAALLLPLLSWWGWHWLRRPRRARAAGPGETPFARACATFTTLHAGAQLPADELADAATDAFRAYLADARGIRALECTTDEIVARLRSTESTARHADDTRTWLNQADAVKFAARPLLQEERAQFLTEGERLLRQWESQT